MLIKEPNQIKSSEITDEKLYLSRRHFLMAGSAAFAGVAAVAGSRLIGGESTILESSSWKPGAKGAFDTDEELTPFKDVTTYNNYYEFGTDKASPARLAHTLETKPWSVAVEGAVGRPGIYALEDLLKPHTLEDRIYRLRCVEGWSMVIPWRGFPLRDLINRLEPTSHAKYVEFTTLNDPVQMPGVRRRVLDWPYLEGLRLDEAMHPLTMLAVGLYGKELPNQNGAPLRLVVPWKYGFKSIKSIVRIRFVEKQPVSSWSASAPREYGFYANVKPQVDHPRWSQGRERRIGEFRKRKTLMFNGYADQVASLYSGMDLRKYF